jgi:murein DD-endopeptidase MepM/ murein hydrolase activator NlpD
MGNIGYSNDDLAKGNDTSGLATNAPVEKLTSGYDKLRGYDASGNPQVHAGIDLVPLNANGTVDETAQILSIGNGTVVKVGNATGFGPNTVVIALSDGNYVTFGHMSAASVTRGQTVSVGDTLGTVGSMGRSTGTHVHIQESIGGPFATSLGFQEYVDPGSH